MYACRCEQCGTTSPAVVTRHGLDEERSKHRNLFRGGHVPDGEQVMEPDKFNVFDVPREQLIVDGIMLLVIVFGLLYRFG
ncbi:MULTISPECIES: hypothetical protein [unclassified Streptomyces]|uniref:hypothetical protein n=1 Tax=unclassified Streptomyces TaxID=2593676 RepID=UPI002E81B4BA|nr:hypothetical protein [Streptomyces sp. NBC_00562]WTC76996.1 hypothetical protein OH719_02915 [Streptomyces sp. NBC_01653]WTD93863.1 hypothetical protein OG891_43940 [Streptomyces sp. NBC_01637]WUC24888.1 hypothetical protein OHA33_42605 [Streptomyces sp. NBC_00562]